MKITASALFLFLGILICKTPYTLQDCDDPAVNSNVVILTSDGEPWPAEEPFTTWSLIYYGCEDGYSYSGPDYSYCYSGSPDYWSPSPTGICSGKCSVPELADDNVIISPLDDVYDPGSTVVFSCSDGAPLSGSEQGTCQSDGTWAFTTEPQCPDGCPAPSNSNGTGSYIHNSDVVFTCNDGYRFESSADTIESKCNNGSWNPSVECVFGGCLPPETPSDVNFTSSPNSLPEDSGIYEVNSKVDLSCADDMTPFGPEFSYCNSSGHWEPDPFLLKCFAKCLAPTFDDARISLASIDTGITSPSYYDSADIIEFTCDGRFVQGPRRATCQDGVWSPDIEDRQPLCRENCTAPLNTDIYNGEGAIYVHGHVEVFRCIDEPGMVRLGGPRAFCNDGTWKPNVLCRYKTEL